MIKSGNFYWKLEPIRDEYSQLEIRIPDLKKFYNRFISYFLSLTLCGKLIEDETIKW